MRVLSIEVVPFYHNLEVQGVNEGDLLHLGVLAGQGEDEPAVGLVALNWGEVNEVLHMDTALDCELAGGVALVIFEI